MNTTPTQSAQSVTITPELSGSTQCRSLASLDGRRVVKFPQMILADVRLVPRGAFPFARDELWYCKMVRQEATNP